MDAFPDGGFVRLESRALRGKFVHANEDWERVSLCPDKGVVPALNTVWRVQHFVAAGDTYVLLQNAAYGRYLSYSMKKKRSGHRGFLATQRDRSEPDGYHARPQDYPWMWRVQSLLPPDQAYVSLRYFTCYLCANNRFFGFLKNFITADLDLAAARFKPAMNWTVHRVEASPLRRPLPRHLPLILVDQVQGDSNALFYPHPPRTIWHVMANNEGEFDQNHYNWPSFAYFGTTLTLLKNQLRFLQDWDDDVTAYTLCMRPGSHGRLMPLITDDLPSSLDSMNIVAFRTASPGAVALRCAAPAPAAADDNAA